MDLTTILLLVATIAVFILIGRQIYQRYIEGKGYVYFVEVLSFEQSEGGEKEEKDWFIYGIFKHEREAELTKENLEQQIIQAAVSKENDKPIQFENEVGRKWTLEELRSFVAWNKKQFIANRMLDVRMREYKLL